MRKCLDCGAELHDTDMSCTACNSENLSLIEIQSDNKRLVTILGIVAAIVAVAGIVASVAYYLLSVYIPAQPVKNGVYAMMSGDLEGCMETMHEELRGNLEKLVGTEDFAEEYKQSIVSEYTNTYGDRVQLDMLISLHIACSRQAQKQKVQRKHVHHHLGLKYKVNTHSA